MNQPGTPKKQNPGECEQCYGEMCCDDCWIDCSSAKHHVLATGPDNLCDKCRGCRWEDVPSGTVLSGQEPLG